MPTATAAITTMNATMSPGCLRIGSTLQQGCEARLQASRDWSHAEVAPVEGTNGPDADARVGDERLVGARELGFAELTFLDSEPFCRRFAQHDPAHDAGHTAAIDLRRRNATVRDQKYVTHRPGRQIAGAAEHQQFRRILSRELG